MEIALDLLHIDIHSLEMNCASDIYFYNMNTLSLSDLNSWFLGMNKMLLLRFENPDKKRSVLPANAGIQNK